MKKKAGKDIPIPYFVFSLHTNSECSILHFFESVGKYSWKFGQMAGNDVCLQSGNHPREEIGEMRGGTSVSSGGILASYISHLAIFLLIFLDGLLYSHLPYICVRTAQIRARGCLKKLLRQKECLHVHSNALLDVLMKNTKVEFLWAGLGPPAY